MATAKISNKDGLIVEIPVIINTDSKKIEKKESLYSVSESGLITQQIMHKLTPGTQKIAFPIEFSTVCNGVFINEELDPEIRSNVSFSNITKSSFDIIVRPNQYNSIGIKIYATGY